MKVILRDDVPSLGRKGEVVEVADGYARNYLFPRSLAVYASEVNLKNLEQHKAILARREAREREEAEKLAQELSKLKISIPVKVGEKGRLFGAVTSKDIAQAVEKNSSVKLDKKKVILKEEIKSLGKYEVTLQLHPQVQAKIWIEVMEEKKKKGNKKTGKTKSQS